MKNFVYFLLFSCGIIFNSNAVNFKVKNSLVVMQEETEVTATISKDTTEAQFEELITYFKENGITVDINEVKYNDDNEIIGIRIRLEKEGQQSSYAMNTNVPIQEVELGYKNSQLFVRSKGNAFGMATSDISSLMQQFGQSGLSSAIDLNDFFNDDNFQDNLGNLSQFFQGSFGNLDDMMGQLQQQFGNSIPQGISSQNHSNEKQKGLPKYKFINKPGINKLIIIDGKEANFETLNTLAENNQLDTVDSLKPATAMSLYGNKAKDGAIIVTTSKK